MLRQYIIIIYIIYNYIIHLIIQYNMNQSFLEISEFIIGRKFFSDPTRSPRSRLEAELAKRPGAFLSQHCDFSQWQNLNTGQSSCNWMNYFSHFMLFHAISCYFMLFQLLANTSRKQSLWLQTDPLIECMYRYDLLPVISLFVIECEARVSWKRSKVWMWRFPWSCRRRGKTVKQCNYKICKW